MAEDKGAGSGGESTPAQDASKGGGQEASKETPKTYTEEELQAERDRAVTKALKTREDNLRAELDKAKGDAEAQMKAIQDNLETERRTRESAEARAEFISESIKHEVVDPEGAYAIVQASEHYRYKNGSVNWKLLKEEKPYLFGSSTQSTHAGAGRGQTGTPGQSVGEQMNTFIRQSAGYE